MFYEEDAPMRVPSVLIIWDYDAAIGQVNASYPYNFHEETLLQEIENVDRILELAKDFELRVTFACLGFAAEPGQFPYHVPEQLRRIRAGSHEIASHSWRHEWFPFLEREQVRRSLRRSKQALEQCLGEPGTVRGFVPPFSRPMTWYKKGAISLGDRSLSPLRVAGNIGSLCTALRDAEYSWCRVSFRSFAQRLRHAEVPPLIGGRLDRSSGIACVPLHYTGFDGGGVDLLNSAVKYRRSVVISGHPSGLSRQKEESLSCLTSFLEHVAELQAAGRIQARSVSEHLALEATAP
jgi:Polysaccharide deacetylase